MTSVFPASPAVSLRTPKPKKESRAKETPNPAKSFLAAGGYTEPGIWRDREAPPVQHALHYPGDAGRDGSTETDESDHGDNDRPITDEERKTRLTELASVAEDPFFNLEEQTVEEVPEDVAKLTASLGPTLKRAWQSGRPEELKAEIEKVNAKIRMLGSEYEKFLVPSKVIITNLGLAANALHAWDNKRDQEIRDGTAVSTCRTLLELIPVLVRCGLSWRMIVDETQIRNFETMIGVANLPERPQYLLTKYIAEDFNKPSVVQTAVVRKSGKKIRGYLNSVEPSSDDIDDAEAALTVANKHIIAHNKIAGLALDDHMLPVELLGSRELFLEGIRALGFDYLDSAGAKVESSAPNVIKPSSTSRGIDENGDTAMPDVDPSNDTSDPGAFGPTEPAPAASDISPKKPAKPSSLEEVGPSPLEQVPPSVQVQTGIPGPMLLDDGTTFLGKIVRVHKWETGSRLIINKGTDGHPIYELRPGSALPRSYTENLCKRPGIVNSKPDLASIGSKVVAVCTGIAYMAAASSRIKYFQVQWPRQEWGTSWMPTSEVSKICGREWVKKAITAMGDLRTKNKRRIRYCKTKNIDPDSEGNEQVGAAKKDGHPWIWDATGVEEEDASDEGIVEGEGDFSGEQKVPQEGKA